MLLPSQTIQINDPTQALQGLTPFILLFFVVDVSVFSTPTANRELLPAPIMTNFPHI
jgi:hypothetical protein